jgi:hypothetical protein
MKYSEDNLHGIHQTTRGEHRRPPSSYPRPAYEQGRISNPSLCKVAQKVGLVERTVRTAPVVLIECFFDGRADSVVVDHIKIATQGVRKLEFMVGREGGEILDLQTVSPHLRVCGLLVAAMTGSGTTKDTRVSICSWRKLGQQYVGQWKR